MYGVIKSNIQLSSYINMLDRSIFNFYIYVFYHFGINLYRNNRLTHFMSARILHPKKFPTTSETLRIL